MAQSKDGGLFTLYISVSAFLLGNFIAFTCTAGPVSTDSFSLVLGVRKSMKGRVVPISWLSTYRDKRIWINDDKQQEWSSLTKDLKAFRNTQSLREGGTEYTWFGYYQHWDYIKEILRNALHLKNGCNYQQNL